MLSDKQTKILSFLQEYHTRWKLWPDIDLIRADIGDDKTLQAMQKTIRKLEEFGCIVRVYAHRRGRRRMTVELSAVGASYIASKTTSGASKT